MAEPDRWRVEFQVAVLVHASTAAQAQQLAEQSTYHWRDWRLADPGGVVVQPLAAEERL